jgi:hypothetical protein
MENRTLLSGLSYFSTVQYSDFIFQLPWKNGKLQFTKWAELFFRQQFFFSGRVGRSYFSASKFFSEGKFFLRASFFSANSIRVLLFFHSKENGGKPHWIFTPPLFIPFTSL